jgi:hypothetical protein
VVRVGQSWARLGLAGMGWATHPHSMHCFAGEIGLGWAISPAKQCIECGCGVGAVWVWCGCGYGCDAMLCECGALWFGLG